MRDKLLDRDSVDIDVALDNMTGIYVTICEFAAVVGEYLNESSSSVVVIDSNPERSKHLVTARMKVNGFWIDMVNLRSETYTSDSRIRKGRWRMSQTIYPCDISKMPIISHYTGN